jgi:hypothetical protein
MCENEEKIDPQENEITPDNISQDIEKSSNQDNEQLNESLLPDFEIDTDLPVDDSGDDD